MNIYEIQKRVEKVAAGNGIEVIGTSAADLTGADLSSPDYAFLHRSPCGLLKWCNQNNPWGYEFVTFYKLHATSAVQGFEILDSEGDLVGVVETPIYGGDNGDAKNVIYENNKAIINILIEAIIEANNEQNEG